MALKAPQSIHPLTRNILSYLAYAAYVIDTPKGSKSKTTEKKHLLPASHRKSVKLESKHDYINHVVGGTEK